MKRVAIVAIALSGCLVVIQQREPTTEDSQPVRSGTLTLPHTHEWEDCPIACPEGRLGCAVNHTERACRVCGATPTPHPEAQP